jgi:hypothetical protein
MYETFLRKNKLRSNAVYPPILGSVPVAPVVSTGATNAHPTTGGVSPVATAPTASSSRLASTDLPTPISGNSPTTSTRTTPLSDDTDMLPPTGGISARKSTDTPRAIGGDRIIDHDNQSTGLPPQTGLVAATARKIPRSDEDKARDAIISINRFDIRHPPLPLRFGEFNPRPLSVAGVRNLAAEFLYETFTPFKMECMIPILLHRGDISDVCINLDLTKSPQLVLTDSVSTKELKYIIACGGNHRLAAVKDVFSDLDKQWEALDDRLSEMKGVPTKKGVKATGSRKKSGATKKKAKSAKGKGKSVAIVDAADEGNDGDDSGNGDDSGGSIVECTAESLISQMENIRDQQQRFSTWGVIVYDSGKHAIH